MVTPNSSNLVRVTLTLDPIDVNMLDRLGKLEGQNRSQEMRGILAHLRPVLLATVEAFEAALAQRNRFDAAAVEAATAGLHDLLPEVEELSRRYLGAMSRLEGSAAVSAASEDSDPRPSNHGGHTPTPPTNPTPPEVGK